MCANCGWKDVLEEIEKLLESGDAEFARDTMEGIAEWVEDNEHVTDGQRLAVSNIGASVNG